MAVVYPLIKAGATRTWATVALSTNADGITGADVCDTGGLALAGVALSTLAGSSCYYTIRGGISAGTSTGATDGLSDLTYVYGTTGGLLTLGTTGVALLGKTMLFDPAPYLGLRYIQLVSNTTGAVNANSPGALARLLLIGMARIDD